MFSFVRRELTNLHNIISARLVFLRFVEQRNPIWKHFRKRLVAVLSPTWTTYRVKISAKAARVEERKIGESDMTFITGCPEAKSVSVLLRGGTEHVVDEIRRAFDDAVGVVSVAWEDGAVLTGGGSVLATLSRDLRTYAETIGGREQMAIEAFASALEIIPRTLAENAGLDPVTTIIALRKAHADGDSHAGINVYEGGVVDMQAANVLEPVRVVEQAIQSATETAIMILRIDDVISSKGVSMADGFGGEDDFHM